MTSPAVHLRDLCKVYVVSEREAGVMAALQSLVHRRTEKIHAVDGISFDLNGGLSQQDELFGLHKPPP